MQATTTFHKLAADLVDAELSHVWRGYGSALFLEFGQLQPSGVRRDGSAMNPKGQFSISIEWSWRIEDSSSIVCGSWSDEALWPQAFQRIKGERVTALSLFGRLPEIDLTLSGDLHVVSFSTTDGQPQWSLVDRRSTPEVWFNVKDGLLVEHDGTLQAE